MNSLLLCHEAKYGEHHQSSIQTSEGVDTGDDDAVPVDRTSRHQNREGSVCLGSKLIIDYNYYYVSTNCSCRVDYQPVAVMLKFVVTS